MGEHGDRPVALRGTPGESRDSREDGTMDIQYTTERMLLRPLSIGDLDELVALHNDPEVMRFLTGGAPIARSEIASQLLAGLWGEGYWAAEAIDTGEFLGWFALHPSVGREHGELEIGYRLHQRAWGQGFATEGARYLIGAGFTDPAVDRILAQTMAVNVRSRRVMEKAGLRFVRVFHMTWDEPLPGSDEGEEEYALERDAWEQSIALQQGQ